METRLPNNYDIKNLVFEGGGIKSLAYLGAVETLTKQYVDINNIKRVGGSSAGAITALLLGLDYSLAELHILFNNTELALFLDDAGPIKDVAKLTDITQEVSPVNFITSIKKNLKLLKAIQSIGDLLKLIREFEVKQIKDNLTQQPPYRAGLLNATAFREDWLESLIYAKTGIKYTTFKELYELKTQSPGQYGAFKDIYLVGLNLNTHRTEVFSYETTPDLIISDALRISMAIPLIFKPHQLYLKQAGKRIAHPAGHCYVDSWLVNNYPLWLFDNTKYMTDKIGYSTANHQTLGFRLVAEEVKQYYENDKQLSITHFSDEIDAYLHELVTTLHSKQECDHKQRLEAMRTIYIDHLDVQAIDFNLALERRQALLNSGAAAVHDYFNRRDKYNEQMLQEVAEDSSYTANGLVVNYSDLNWTNSRKQTVLDIALNQNNKHLIITLVLAGAYRCQNPTAIYEVLLDAYNNGFFNRQAFETLAPRFKTSLSTPVETQQSGNVLSIFKLKQLLGAPKRWLGLA